MGEYDWDEKHRESWILRRSIPETRVLSFSIGSSHLSWQYHYSHRWDNGFFEGVNMHCLIQISRTYPFTKYNTCGASNTLQILPSVSFQGKHIPSQIYSLTLKNMRFSLEKVYLILTAAIFQQMFFSEGAISFKKMCSLFLKQTLHVMITVHKLNIYPL